MDARSPEFKAALRTVVALTASHRMDSDPASAAAADIVNELTPGEIRVCLLVSAGLLSEFIGSLHLDGVLSLLALAAAE